MTLLDLLPERHGAAPETAELQRALQGVADGFAEGARLLGVPVANFKREVKSFAMLAATESDNYVMQYYMEKTSLSMNYSGNSGTFMDILYNAIREDSGKYVVDVFSFADKERADALAWILNNNKYSYVKTT